MRPAECGEGKQAYVQQRWREGVRRKAESALEKEPLHASQKWHYWVESSDSASPNTHLQAFSWSSADRWTYSNYGKEKPQRHSCDQITVLCLSLPQLSLCSNSNSVPKTIAMLWSCLTSLMPFPAVFSGPKNQSTWLQTALDPEDRNYIIITVTDESNCLELGHLQHLRMEIIYGCLSSETCGIGKPSAFQSHVP